ncbi:MAG: aldehyde dehydrogenase [Phycisphaerales bacterium]
MSEILNLINGRAVPARAGQWLDVIDPARGETYARVAASEAADVPAAVDAAKGAFAAWSGTPAAERSRIMLRWADLLEARLEQFAQAESVDAGKPISATRAADIPRSIGNLRFFATAILHTHSQLHETDMPSFGPPARALNYTLRRPRGVAGLITPWNFPLHLFTWKIAPALATGNTVVAKPSEMTPMTAAMLGELAKEAGLPDGVLNIVHGTGTACGGAIVQHADVPTISFTGSTGVGKWIGTTAGGMLKRVSLELGGKNPFVIFDDADLPAAIDTAARAAFSNQGQICLCGSRLLVQAGVFDRVLAGMVERANALKIGDPLDAATQHGPQVSAVQLEKVEGYVKLARELGGKVHCGGERVPTNALPARCEKGFFFRPTVISGLDPACRVEQEEIFGPVVTMQRFETEEQALALANGTPFGLAAAVFTSNLGRAHRFASRLAAGVIWVNCWMLRDLRTPFGGVKQSGVGREGGNDALKFFTESSNVCVQV